MQLLNKMEMVIAMIVITLVVVKLEYSIECKVFSSVHGLAVVSAAVYTGALWTYTTLVSMIFPPQSQDTLSIIEFAQLFSRCPLKLTSSVQSLPRSM